MIHKFINNDERNMVPHPDYQFMKTDNEQLNPLLRVHDPHGSDINYSLMVSNEIIRISGAPLTVYIRTDDMSYDKIWEEQRDPTYWAGRKMRAFYKPENIEIKQTGYGPDVSLNFPIIFSRADVYREFNDRMIRPDDIIKLSYNTSAIQPKYFRVTNAFDSGQWRYTWLYFTVDVTSMPTDKAWDILGE